MPSRPRAVAPVAVATVLTLLAGAAYAGAAHHHKHHGHKAHHWHPPAPTHRRLMRGLSVSSRYDHKLRSMIHIAALHPGAAARIEPVPASTRAGYGDLDRTSRMCRRVDCLVAVNGSFRDIPSKQPRGAEVVGGVPLRLHSSEPSQALLSAQRPVAVRSLQPQITLHQAGIDDLTIKAINVDPKGHGIRLLTPRFGDATPKGLTVPLTFSTDTAFRLGRHYRVTVGGLRAGVRRPLRPGTVVLFAHGKGAGRKLAAYVRGIDRSRPAHLAALVGGPIGQSIGTSFRLLQGGHVAVPRSDWDLVNHRNPRTVLAWKKNGTVLLITIDGRSRHSRGATLREAAHLARRLGAVGAVNLDGGGSTTFVVDGHVRNRPSDGRERGVVNALALVADPDHPYDPGYAARQQAKRAADKQKDQEKKAGDQPKKKKHGLLPIPLG